MIEIRKSSVDEILGNKDWDAVVEKYAEESSIEGMPRFKVDVPLYKKLESAGMLFAFAAFDDEHLIGFISILITPLPHYSEKNAKVESWFVLKEFRHSGVGLRLRNLAKELAEEKGAVGIIICAPVGGALAKTLHKDKTCVHTNDVFFMRLK